MQILGLSNEYPIVMIDAWAGNVAAEAGDRDDDDRMFADRKTSEHGETR